MAGDEKLTFTDYRWNSPRLQPDLDKLGWTFAKGVAACYFEPVAGAGRRRIQNRSMPSGLLDEDRTSKAACLARGLRLERLAKSVQVIWNRRLRTTAGRAWYSVDVIELNPRILAFGDPEVDRTLLHELAHLVAHERAGSRKISPHGVEWKQACAELGIPGEAAKHQLPMPRTQQARRFLYRCPSCGVEIRKARRFRSPAACLACCRKYAGGQFDKRFVLNGPETS